MSRNWIYAVALAFCAPSVGLAQTGVNSYYNQSPELFGVSYRQDESTVVAAPANDISAELEALKLRIAELEKSNAASGDAIDTKRLVDLEKGLEENSKAIDKVSDTLPSLVNHGHKKPSMKLSGRIHLDYWGFPEAESGLFALEGGNPQDRFAFRRLRLGVAGNLSENVRYKYEGEFAGGNNVEYRDAYMGFDNLPWLETVLVGNHKRPYGLDHLNSSRFNVFLERPFGIEAFNQDARRLGISANGVSKNQVWNWRYGVWNQDLIQDSAGYIGDHYQLEAAGRLAATPWYDETSDGRGYAHFAVSGMVGTPDGRPGSTNNQARYRTRPEARSSGRWLDTGAIAGADTNSLIGLETAINVGAFQFVGEYQQVTVERSGGAGPDVTFDGGYVQASYFLTGEHIPWDRETGTIDRIKPFQNFFAVRDCAGCPERGWGAWQVATRYSTLDLTDADIIGGVGNAWTFALNWYWNPYARLQTNYSIGEIDRAPLGSGDYQTIGMRMSVDF